MTTRRARGLFIIAGLAFALTLGALAFTRAAQTDAEAARNAALRALAFEERRGLALAAKLASIPPQAASRESCRTARVPGAPADAVGTAEVPGAPAGEDPRLEGRELRREADRIQVEPDGPFAPVAF